MAERHPRLKLIIDHLGRPPSAKKDEAAWTNLDEMLALARYPTVAIKATALGSGPGARHGGQAVCAWREWKLPGRTS